MKKIILLVLSLSVISLLLVTTRVDAYEFPIKELGLCRNSRECHLFCQLPTNQAACWSYSIYGNKSEVLGDATPEASLSEIGVTFPIATLGNCTDTKACKAFCSIVENKTACTEFATQFKKPQVARLVEKAKEELGCTTAQECRAFCTDEANKDSCTTFAKKYHLGGLIRDRLVETIQQELGCTDRQSCKALCELPENKERCQAIAKRVNPQNITPREKVIEAAKERLGCTTFEECKAFCQNKENREQCKNFGAAVTERVKTELKEKGSCTNVEECRKACAENPQKCPNFPKSAVRAATGGGERKIPLTPLKPLSSAKPEFPPTFDKQKVEQKVNKASPKTETNSQTQTTTGTSTTVVQ